MNTYNENLQSAVNKTLNALELEDKQLESKANAAKFTLYYAEGARITADDVLARDQKTYKEQSKVNVQAVINNNIATNMEATAESQKTETAKAVSNISTAAANVDAANKAILKLSSDVGGLLNIAMPADFKAEIHSQCKDASDLIRLTAYHSEKASELGMKASELTAEITANAVDEKAKLTETEIENLMKTAQEQFKSTSNLIETDHLNISKARTVEKAAEGALKDSIMQYDSSVKAYKASNQALNFGLRVPKSTINSTGFTVMFNALSPPFEFTKPSPESEDQFYDVKMIDGYKLLVVPAQKKMLFNLTSAELALLGDGTYLDVPIVKGQKKYTVPITLNEVKDIDGKDLNLGVNYVVFLYAEINKAYKKLINNYEDVLSVASAHFSVTHKLIGPKRNKIAHSGDTISFNIENVDQYTQDLLTDKKFEFRCILLQKDVNDIMGVMNKEDLKNIESEISQLEQIAEEYDPQIEKLTSSVNALKGKGLALDLKLEEVASSISENGKAITELAGKTQRPDPNDKDANSELDDLKNQQKMHLKNQTTLSKQQEKNADDIKAVAADLTKVIEAKESAMSKVKELKSGIEPFFFDQNIASTVTEANYIKGTAKLVSANSAQGKKPAKTKGKSSTNTKDQSGSDKNQNSEAMSISCTFKIENNTTDNFGNVYNADNIYFPAVLTASITSADLQNQYTNHLVIGKANETSK